MKNIICAISEYIHYRKLFIGMENQEVFEYDVVPGTAAEYAQAHSLGFDLEGLQVIKALAKAKKASEARQRQFLARIGATSCQ